MQNAPKYAVAQYAAYDVYCSSQDHRVGVDGLAALTKFLVGPKLDLATGSSPPRRTRNHFAVCTRLLLDKHYPGG